VLDEVFSGATVAAICQARLIMPAAETRARIFNLGHLECVIVFENGNPTSP
jgi:hypothetical protein